MRKSILEATGFSSDSRYIGKTWAQVLEENEWFDGEKEIEAAAKERWREINQQATKVRLPEVTRALRKARRRP